MPPYIPDRKERKKSGMVVKQQHVLLKSECMFRDCYIVNVTAPHATPVLFSVGRRIKENSRNLLYIKQY